MPSCYQRWRAWTLDTGPALRILSDLPRRTAQWHARLLNLQTSGRRFLLAATLALTPQSQETAQSLEQRILWTSMWAQMRHRSSLKFPSSP
ncbi:hypothetical protein BD311DRAFT_554700 [Dichomitus squalens]|uniref:Uncharacterized protein n=1 Tax=Dichomitus squalens TaxID=114155 RepID=A0A4V6MWU8_9APHY|nr:hypothetical protein BD311DRAFT_554700 [Dichomitus squalens]TBU60298.1 hypothetical protein BD310DRAFT_340672 [Dichomitus squalens]